MIPKPWALIYCHNRHQTLHQMLNLAVRILFHLATRSLQSPLMCLVQFISGVRGDNQTLGLKLRALRENDCLFVLSAWLLFGIFIVWEQSGTTTYHSIVSDSWVCDFCRNLLFAYFGYYLFSMRTVVGICMRGTFIYEIPCGNHGNVYACQYMSAEFLLDTL